MSRKCWMIFVLILMTLPFIGCSPIVDQGGGVPGTPWQPQPLWLTDGFDFPVGTPDGRGWSVTGYSFLSWSNYSKSYHPGEDWNIPGAGNADHGQPVYSVANGEVVFSGWNTALGNVILIKHTISAGNFVWSQYAHLDERWVTKGELVSRRQPIGTVGRGPNNRFAAHLHFEMRKENLPANAWPRSNGVAWSSSKVTDYWLRPTSFINQNRPQ